MTKKELDSFFKRANKVITNYENKLNTLNYDYFIISNVIFISDTEYYYLFNVFKDNQIIEKIPINNTSDYNKTFKELSIKYKTNVIYNYNDLNYKQLMYLDSVDDDNINKGEISDLLFKKQFDILN